METLSAPFSSNQDFIALPMTKGSTVRSSAKIMAVTEITRNQTLFQTGLEFTLLFSVIEKASRERIEWIFLFSQFIASG
jgi:hypothetical protein